MHYATQLPFLYESFGFFVSSEVLYYPQKSYVVRKSFETKKSNLYHQQRELVFKSFTALDFFQRLYRGAQFFGGSILRLTTLKDKMCAPILAMHFLTAVAAEDLHLCIQEGIFCIRFACAAPLFPLENAITNIGKSTFLTYFSEWLSICTIKLDQCFG